MQLPMAAKAGVRVRAPAAPNRDLPEPIHEARRRLDAAMHDQLYGLPRRAYHVMWVYLGHVNLRDTREVWDTSSEEIETATGYQRSSVTGANRDLIAWGLIERPPQRLTGAPAPISQTFLTPWARALFFSDGGAQKAAPPVEKELESKGQGAAPEPAVDNPAQPQQPEPTEQLPATKPAQVAPEQPAVQKVHVRADLLSLAAVIGEQHLPPVLAECRRRGVWLQHLLAEKLQAIKAAGTPLGYLLALIRCGRVWAPPTPAQVPTPAPDDAPPPQRDGAIDTFLAGQAGRWLAPPENRSLLIGIRSAGLTEYRLHGRHWVSFGMLDNAVQRVMSALQAGRLAFIESTEAKALLGTQA